MKNVMVRAWEIYRTLEGDHLAKLAMSLRMAWKEIKSAENFELPEMSEYAMVKKGFGLPALIGTEDQIKWARQIRKEILQQLAFLTKTTNAEGKPINGFVKAVNGGKDAVINYINDFPSDYSDAIKAEKRQQRIDGFFALARVIKNFNEIASHADCRYWIDNRTNQLKNFANKSLINQLYA